MPVDLKRLLRSALDDIEREEEHDRLEARFKALEEKKPDLRLNDLVSALENASDEELRALEGTVLGNLVKEIEQGDGGDGGAGGKGPPEPPTPPPPPAKKTRPGRKSGMAYDWWIDDDGKVVKLDTARVYTGDDEDDEIELSDE